MAKKGGSSAPDPRVNRVSTSTPYGSVEYSGPLRNWAKVKLSPDQKKILRRQEEAQQIMALQARRLGSNLSSAKFKLPDNLPKLDTGPLDLGLPKLKVDNRVRRRVEDAYFNRGQRLLNRQFDRQENRLTQRLANQGLPQGAEAYGSEFGTFNQGRNDAFADLADRAVIAGGDELARDFSLQSALRGQLFGERVTSRNLESQARTQARTQLINEAILQRTVPLNELLALMGSTQVEQPLVFAPGTVQQQQKKKSGFLGGLFGAVGTGVGAYYGGPQGAMAGGAAGSSLGNGVEGLF